ncbi:MAG: hypothetical protein ACTH0D_08130 [Candidatus Corynebacterium faecigallinarum]|uniref:hypothetical protein n=1 Tax=Candidatus Corynebacterium faecigallinarum TaxID=2838528 RepID=UPI003FB7555D
MNRSAARSADHDPGGVPSRTWAIIGGVAVVASFILLPIAARVGATSSADTAFVLIPLTWLLFSWGILGGIVNGTGLSTRHRATLWQVIAGAVLVVLAMWFGRQDAGEPVIFSLGLLVYPGVALIINPMILRVVRRRRSGG